MLSRLAYVAAAGFGAAVALFLLAGFNKYIQASDIHPERHLTARDELALEMAFRLATCKTAPDGGWTEAARDKIMAEGYVWANSFLREKTKQQAKIRAALDLVPGYFTTQTDAQKKLLYTHEIGDPHTHFDRNGRLVLDEIGGK